MNENHGFYKGQYAQIFVAWNSFRDFNEISLYSDFYYVGAAEYRYLVGEQAFFVVHLILLFCLRLHFKIKNHLVDPENLNR